MHRTRLYRGGELALENFPAADISDHLEDPESLVWLDLCAPDEKELRILAEEFDLHELALEDAVNRRQRPKLDHHDSHQLEDLRFDDRPKPAADGDADAGGAARHRVDRFAA